jgi:hypothetical protein
VVINHWCKSLQNKESLLAYCHGHACAPRRSGVCTGTRYRDTHTYDNGRKVLCNNHETAHLPGNEALQCRMSLGPSCIHLTPSDFVALTSYYFTSIQEGLIHTSVHTPAFSFAKSVPNHLNVIPFELSGLYHGREALER